MSEALINATDQNPDMYPSEIDVIRAIATNAKRVFLSQTHDYIETQLKEVEAETRADIAQGRVAYANPERALELQGHWRRAALMEEDAIFARDRLLVQRLRKRRGLDA
jgi:hypothetical protein